MKISAIIIYSPFVLSLLGGVVAISGADFLMKVIFMLMAFILLSSITLSITGKDFRYKSWMHIIAAVTFFIFYYYLIVLISWKTAGKPGTIFYSGPQKFYHIFNAGLSISALIATLPCVIYASDAEQFLKIKIKSSTGIVLTYIVCAIIVIVSAAIWYGYLTLPTQEFG